MALIVTVAAVDEAVNMPAPVIEPADAVHLTAVLNEPVPWIVAEHVEVPPVCTLVGSHLAATLAIVGDGGGGSVADGGKVAEPPPQPTRKNMQTKSDARFIVQVLAPAIAGSAFSSPQEPVHCGTSTAASSIRSIQ